MSRLKLSENKGQTNAQHPGSCQSCKAAKRNPSTPTPLFSENNDPAHAGCHVKKVAAGVSRLKPSENKGQTNAQHPGSCQSCKAAKRNPSTPTPLFSEKNDPAHAGCHVKNSSSRREPAQTFRKPKGKPTPNTSGSCQSRKAAKRNPSAPTPLFSEKNDPAYAGCHVKK